MNDLLKRVHEIVSRAISDDEILRGVTLTPAGFVKLARKLGTSEHEARALFNSLVDYLRRGDALSEDRLRQDLDRDVSAEPDALGNVTLRNRKTGKQAFVRSATPTRVLDKMKTLDEARFRAMTSDEEDPDEEQEHWDAHRETGFYGAQGSGCIVLAQDTGRILVALRSLECEEPHTWGNFGGALSAGDDPKENAVKELYEETGYDGPTSKVIPLYVFQKGTFRYSNFLVVVPSEFQPHLNWEADDAEWVEFGQWPQPLHFGLTALFNDAASVAKIKAAVAECCGPVTESAEPLEEDSYDDEIRSTGGTYNFPWHLGHRHGLGTARWSGSTTMRINVISIRDTDGRPVADLSEDERAEIQQQAIDFIGDA
jgi:8-oxo-dGTP pyrophosphatase MutT (NUDIX family)